MALRVIFAEQSTGIVTTRDGQWAPGTAPFERVAGMTEALSLARRYLEKHPGHEVWIGSSVSSHRIIPPDGRGFDLWIARYRADSSLGAVRAGLTYGEIIAMLGWPDDSSSQLRRSPMAVILRYQPKDVDFHFDDGGRLILIHQDDVDDPVTILPYS